jgi:hypothetical protein
MICPYHRAITITIVQYAYDQDSRETESALVEEYTLMQCQQEKCGAWRNGYCNYNQQVT